MDQPAPSSDEEMRSREAKSLPGWEGAALGFGPRSPNHRVC